jgi:hypothetical protein
MQRDLLSTVGSNDTLLDMRSSVAVTRNRVKNIFEIRFSLRRSSEQRLALPNSAITASPMNFSTLPLQRSSS